MKTDELEELLFKISTRKDLEKRIKAAGEKTYESREEVEFFSFVLRGKELKEFAEPTAQWQKRECFSKIHDYVYENITDRVFILYGLRRTGKTTLIRQLIAEMTDDMLEKTAFMQVNSTLNLA